MTPAEVKAARKKMNFTQEQFAAALGVTVQTVSAWENDRSRVNNISAIAIKCVCGIP